MPKCRASENTKAAEVIFKTSQIKIFLYFSLYLKKYLYLCTIVTHGLKNLKNYPIAVRCILS